MNEARSLTVWEWPCGSGPRGKHVLHVSGTHRLSRRVEQPEFRLRGDLICERNVAEPNFSLINYGLESCFSQEIFLKQI